VVKVAYGLLLDKQTAPRFCFPPSSRQCKREGGCSRSVLSPFPHPRLAQEATPRLVVCPRAVKETCGWPRTAAHFTVRKRDDSRDGSHFFARQPQRRWSALAQVSFRLPDPTTLVGGRGRRHTSQSETGMAPGMVVISVQVSPPPARPKVFKCSRFEKPMRAKLQQTEPSGSFFFPQPPAQHTPHFLRGKGNQEW
jgi:hypothetical protein